MLGAKKNKLKCRKGENEVQNKYKRRELLKQAALYLGYDV